MVNVWKLGSNWGNGGESILDLFLDYECVFFRSTGDGGIGDWHRVRQGDLFIVADGKNPVAIGIAIGTFMTYADCGIRFRKKDVDDFIDDDVVVCPTRLILLSEEERHSYWGMETRRRFCHAPGAAERVRLWWNKHEASEKQNPFMIRTGVASLLVKGEDEIDPIINDKVRYKVPIYQRPYSWGEPELRRLVEDIHQGLVGREDTFLGTIQLSQPVPLNPEGTIVSYDIIDGQQRLTTFLLLLAILEKTAKGQSNALMFAKKSLRTSVNRRTAQDDLEAALAYFDNGFPNDDVPTSRSGNPYIENANILYGLLREFGSSINSIDDNVDDAPAAEGEISQYGERMLEYLSQRVKFVVLETHAGLSKTLKIFNTINSSGLDLGSEDLFKVRFYEYLKRHGASDGVFDQISELYGRVDEYNRHRFIGVRLSMSQVLASYQRVLIARCDLNAALFSMSSDKFFEGLFDTAFGIRAASDFKTFVPTTQLSSNEMLSLDDLMRIFECHVAYLEACSKDVELRIARNLLWETRYGYAADFPVLAMIKGIVTPQTVKRFVWGLFKSVVPASLYYGKHVYHGRSCLLELLKGIWNGSFCETDFVVVWAKEKWRFNNGLNSNEMLDAALDYQIAGTPKWKNLLCKLVEYIMSPTKDDALFERLFHPPKGFDIEHIQSFTAENEKTRQKLGWSKNDDELNKIGNLAMFESNLNRSVKNKQLNKQSAYAKSSYVCIQKIKDMVIQWSKDNAKTRRRDISNDVKAFLLAP